MEEPDQGPDRKSRLMKLTFCKLSQVNTSADNSTNALHESKPAEQPAIGFPLTFFTELKTIERLWRLT